MVVCEALVWHSVMEAATRERHVEIIFTLPDAAAQHLKTIVEEQQGLAAANDQHASHQSSTTSESPIGGGRGPAEGRNNFDVTRNNREPEGQRGISGEELSILRQELRACAERESGLRAEVAGLKEEALRREAAVLKQEEETERTRSELMTSLRAQAGTEKELRQHIASLVRLPDSSPRVFCTSRFLHSSSPFVGRTPFGSLYSNLITTSPL